MPARGAHRVAFFVVNVETISYLAVMANVNAPTRRIPLQKGAQNGRRSVNFSRLLGTVLLNVALIDDTASAIVVYAISEKQLLLLGETFD